MKWSHEGKDSVADVATSGKDKKKVKAPRRRPRLEGNLVTMHLATRPGTHTCWVCGDHDQVRQVRRSVKSHRGLALAGGLLFGALGAVATSMAQTEGTVCLPVCQRCEGRWKLAEGAMVVVPLLLLVPVVVSVMAAGPHSRALVMAGGGLAWAAASVISWFLAARAAIQITLRDNQIATLRVPRPELVAAALARDEAEEGDEPARPPARERRKRG